MAGLSQPADREHLRILRELRRAGLNPTVLAITSNDDRGCAYCHELGHSAEVCPQLPGEQAHLFA